VRDAAAERARSPTLETMNATSRRTFLQASAAAAAVSSLPRTRVLADDKQKSTEPLFKISLAQWSLNKALFGKKLDNLDFAKTAKEDYGIDAIEFVNQFFKDKAKDEKYLAELKKRADDLA
jgi:hypothetical protein